MNSVCHHGVTAKWIWLLPFWSYLRSAFVLDIRSASESLVCAAAVTITALRIEFAFRTKLRQLGDIRRDPPRLILGKHFRRRSPLWSRTTKQASNSSTDQGRREAVRHCIFPD
jgi:hypothetical protein